MKKLVPVYPWPMHPKVAEVVNAIPDINVVAALPGGPMPALVIGSKRPPFAGDFIVVTNPENLYAAVKVIIGDGIEMVTMAQSVSTTFGANGQREVVERAEVSQVRFN